MWSTIFSESRSVLYFISVGNQWPLCRSRFPTEYPFPLRTKKRGGRHKGGRASGQLSIINEHCIKNGSSSQATDDRGILLDVARCSFFCVACVAVHSVDAGGPIRDPSRCGCTRDAGCALFLTALAGSVPLMSHGGPMLAGNGWRVRVSGVCARRKRMSRCEASI